MPISLVGVGSALPRTVETNEDLARHIDTSDEWIKARTGISQRWISSSDETTSTLAVAAAQRALETAGLDRVDLINAQLALWVEQALWARRVRDESDLEPSVVAGHSAGEIYALTLAGVLSESDGLAVVEARARAMAGAADNPGEMMAVVGLGYHAVHLELDRLAAADLWIANVNTTDQVVLSGTPRSIDRALGHFGALDGVRVKKLATGGAFHCPMMDSAREVFADALESFTFAEPAVDIPSNRDGRTHTGDEWKQLLAEQITTTVRWDLCTNTIVERSDEDTELSGKRTLGRMLDRRRARASKSRRGVVA